MILEYCKNTKLPFTFMFKSHSRLHPHIKYHEASQNAEVHGSSYQRLGHI